MRQQIYNFFQQFARNERWGTCADCPRRSIVGGYAVYPEFCKNTDRSDHHLPLSELVRIYELERKNAEDK